MTSSAEISVNLQEKKKYNVFVGAINENTWNRVQKLLVKHVRTHGEPILIGMVSGNRQ